MVVARTVQLSRWTSIKYATAGIVPAIVLCTAIGRRHSTALFSHKKGGTPTPAKGQEYPLKIAKKRGLPRFLALAVL